MLLITNDIKKNPRSSEVSYGRLVILLFHLTADHLSPDDCQITNHSASYRSTRILTSRFMYKIVKKDIQQFLFIKILNKEIYIQTSTCL